ncbi:MAG: leucine-rich repeat domain-containing protein [Clostridia bacterium]|nr:leucine-rich repeat domain-containing protein [Clostridia bacterium]
MKKSLLVILAALLLLLCSCSDSTEEPEETTMSPEELAKIDEWQARAEPFMDMFEYVAFPDHVEIEAFIDPAMDNWYEYINTQGKSAVKELVVPAYIDGLPVSVIREGTFGEYYHGASLRSRGECLVKVELPPTVTEIGDYAFKRCLRLAYIEFSDNVREIGEGAFYKCEKLRRLKIPDGITEIKENTFYQCISLSELIIPDSVTAIGAHAFYGTRELVDVVLPPNLTTIADFYSIPTGFMQSLKGLECGDFYCAGKDNSIALRCYSTQKHVTVPAGIETVVMWFENNDIVETITIPGSVRRVINHIDGKPNLKKVVFEEGVEELRSCWFNAVPNLTEVYFPESIRSSVMSVWETMSEMKYGTDFNEALTFYVKKGSYMDEYFRENNYKERGANIVYY